MYVGIVLLEDAYSVSISPYPVLSSETLRSLQKGVSANLIFKGLIFFSYHLSISFLMSLSYLLLVLFSYDSLLNLISSILDSQYAVSPVLV